MTPVPDVGVRPMDHALDIVASGDYASGDPWVSNWVSAYRARAFYFRALWTNDGGNLLGEPRIEFSDDGVTRIAGNNAYLAMGGPNAPGWVTDVQQAASHCPIPWPFVCPYKYARLVGDIPGGLDATVTDMMVIGTAEVSPDDRVFIERVSLWATQTFTAADSPYDSAWIDGALGIQAVLAELRFAGATHARPVFLRFSPDGSNIFNADPFILAAGGSVIYPGSIDVLDGNAMFYAAASQGGRSAGSAGPMPSFRCFPFDNVGMELSVSDDMDASVDAILFRRP